MGFVITTTPKESIRIFCKAYGIKKRKDIQISSFFDLKGSGDLKFLDDKPNSFESNSIFNPIILLNASLNEVVYIARLMKDTIGCNAVRFAWPEGSGVIIEDKTLITSIPIAGYLEMSRIVARDEFLSVGYTEEEADKLVEEEGRAYDCKVDMRDWLQETWQDVVIASGSYPTINKLKKKQAFAELFNLGFEIKQYKKTDHKKLESAIQNIVGNGPSYKDINKAKRFLTWSSDESTYQHRDRCHDFFKNAPKSFLNKVQVFEELLPITAGFFIEYASPNVRSNIGIGKLAAQKINGFPDGYSQLEEPALSDHEVICIALSSNPNNLNFVPSKLSKKLSILNKLIIKNKLNENLLDETAFRKIINRDLLDFIVCWCIGQVQSLRLKSDDLTTLHNLIREFQINNQ